MIGVFLKVGEGQGSILEEMHPDSLAEGGTIDIGEFIKGISSEFLHYQGSLTTPPCSEIVNWFVLKAPQEISKAQMEGMELHWAKHLCSKKNYRVVQPLEGRTVYKNF